MADVEIDVLGEIPSNLGLDKTISTKGFFRYVNVNSFKSWFGSAKESIRPWGEFANTTNFKFPPNFPRLMKRAVNNVKHFQGNYVVVSMVLMAYCLLTSPLLLLSIFASLVACYILTVRNAEKKLRLAGKEVPVQQQYMAVGLCSLPLYWWAGVGQAVFWVLGASCFVISLHAGLYNIEAILKEEDQFEVLLDQVSV